MNSLDFEQGAAHEASPTQALAFLWRGRWLIAAFTLLAAAGGILLAEQRGTIWRARSVLYVERESPMMPGSDVSLWVRSRNYANTQSALLRSNPVLQAGIEAVGDSPIFGDTGNRLGWLQRSLKTSVGAQDDLITVTLDSKLVGEACHLVNAIVDAYLRLHTASNRESASTVLTNLTAELERYEGELQTVQREEVEFLRNNPGVGPTQDARVLAAERFRELHNALTRAEIEVVEAEAAWKSAKSLAGSADLLRQLPLAGRDGGTLAPPRASTELLQLRDELQRLLTQVTPEHPEVTRLQTLIAAAEKKIHASDTEVADGYIALLEHRLAGARQKAAELRARVADYEEEVRGMSPAQAQYRAIEIRRERLRKITDVLYDRVRTLDINERLDDTKMTERSALVYERATPGGATVAFSKRMLVAIATFLGLILGTGAAWFRSLVDQRLRAPWEVAGLLPLLGTAPRVTRRRPILDTWRRSTSFAAAMRSLRTVLRFGVRGGEHRLLQITSPVDPGSNGIIAAGLGIALAQAGERTLIVDADFANGDQQRLFGIEARVGLAQVLAGASVEEAILDTGVTNLKLLAAGDLGRNAEPLPFEAGLGDLLRSLADRFDRLLVVTAPLLPDPDARLVAAECDDTLLVVRSARTTRTEVRSALGAIASVAGRLAGAVLEGVAGSLSIGVGGDLRPLQPDGSAATRTRTTRTPPDLDIGLGRSVRTS